MTNRLNRSVGGTLFLLFFLGFLGIFMVIPLVFTISNAFKPLNEFYLFPPKLFVRNPTLTNFTDLKQILANFWIPFTRYLFNSLWVVVLGTGGHVLFVSLAAYPMAKHDFPGKNLLFSITVLALMFSPEVTKIPNFIIMSKLGLIDTYTSMIIPSLVFPLGLFLMKQYMEDLPDSLIESAKCEGASEYAILFRIIIPLVKPALMTIVLFNFTFVWSQTSGEMGGGYIFSEKLKTLPYVLVQITQGGFGSMQVFAWDGIVAVINFLLISIPIAVFLITQSSIVETMATSGIKD
ncbi:MAG: carbohydrate ABC transporter permease [Spirochaetales bacterium]|nr:carbohydrate ABC transporter permease [Spirochaetales bacterium]